MYKNKRRTQPKKCEKPKKTTKNRAKGNKGKGAPCVDFAKTSKFGARRCTTTDNAGTIRDKITSERVTVPLEFFSHGVKSKTARRTAKDCTFKEQSCRFLNEDLHALLQTVSVSSAEVVPSPRCASKEGSSVQTHFKSIADYYVKVESQQVLPQTSRGGNSLFKEINCLFREAVPKPNRSTENANDLVAPQTKTNKLSGCFCQKLKEQLSSVTLTSRRGRCIKRITALVAEIDTVLEGQETAFPLEVNIRNATKSKTEANVLPGVPPLIPKCSWQYKTPSSQQLRRPVVTSCSGELKPCILQAGIQSKVVFELGTSITDFDFLDKKFNAAYNTLTTSICDVVNKSANFNEHFKVPPVNMQPSRSAMSLFNNNTVPLFEEPLQTLPHKSRNLLVARRPRKAARNIIRDNLGTPRCLFFGKVAKRQKLLPITCGQEKENEAVVASPTRFQRGSNCRPQDFSNHPKSANETFIIDENFLLPTIPNLSDPLPLSFYPRKAFGAE